MIKHKLSDAAVGLRKISGLMDHVGSGNRQSSQVLLKKSEDVDAERKKE